MHTYDLVIVDKCQIVLVLLLECVGSIMAGAREVRIEPYGLIEVLYGAVEVAFAGMDGTPIAEGDRTFCIVSDCLVAILHGTVEITLPQVCSTAIVERLSEFPVEPFLLVLVPYCAVKVVLARERRYGQKHDALRRPQLRLRTLPLLLTHQKR